MTENELIEKLASSVGEVPPHAEVYTVRRYSVDELWHRAKRLIRVAGEHAIFPELPRNSFDRLPATFQVSNANACVSRKARSISADRERW